MSSALREVLTDDGLAGNLMRCAGELVASRHTPGLRARRLTEIYAQLLA